jgi:hypothetical protein
MAEVAEAFFERFGITVAEARPCGKIIRIAHLLL